METTKRFNLEQWYECDECHIKFSTQKPLKRKAFCPSCGENFTKRTPTPKISSRETYKEWTKSELRLLEKVISGELQVYQVALKLGRSRQSVDNKARRIKRSRGDSHVVRNK